MQNNILLKLDKDIGIASIRSGRISKGLDTIEKYLSELDYLIKTNSDNEKYTIEKNKTLEEYKMALAEIAPIAFSNQEWIDCLKCCQLMIKYNSKDVLLYKYASLCLSNLKRHETALEMMRKYRELQPNDPDMDVLMGAALFFADINNANEAIELYQRFINNHPYSYRAYNELGHLFATLNAENPEFQEQLYYFEKASELCPQDKSIMRNLVLTYEKMGDWDKAHRLIEVICNENPDEALHEDWFSLAVSFIRRGDFIRGWQLYEHRFQKEFIKTYYPNIKKPKWNGDQNLSRETLLVHYEQGFGDTMMFIRFAEECLKYAKDVVVVVQDEVYQLLEESQLGLNICPASADMSRLHFDYHVPLITLPKIFKTTPNTIPKTGGYLSVHPNRIKDYGDTFIKTIKLKVGVNFSGIKSKSEQKKLRDIDWRYLKQLSEIKDIQLYCFNRDMRYEDFKEIDESIDIVCLGESFRDFADTAAAACNMDLMITTDNCILNLCGALGLKTLALFNQNREYRWYGVEEGRMIWYDSVKPLMAQRLNEWQPVFDEVIREINQMLDERFS